MALKLGDLARVPSRQKAFLVVVLCALAATGYYYLFYKAAAQEAAALKVRYDELQSKIKEQRNIAQNLPTFRAEVQRLEAQLAVLLEQLPNTAEIPALLRSISDVGKEAGLEFLKFAPQPETQKGFYAEIPVAIAVSGGYHNFVLFADRVGHLPRIVNISDIGFSSPTRVDDTRYTVNVSCTATTYRFLEQAAKAQAEGKKGASK